MGHVITLIQKCKSFWISKLICNILVSYNLSLWGLDEVDLEEGLEVQVSNLIIVTNTEEFGECCIWKNASLERWVKA
jgi:hypothetical protein